MNNHNGIRVLEAKDSFTRIKNFMSNQESGVMLSAAEEKILDRMMYAHGLLAEKKYTEDDVAEKVKVKFDVSIYTAKNDIRNTYSLFAIVTEDYKRYAIRHHIDFLNNYLAKCVGDKSMAHLVPKISDSIINAWKILPVLATKPNIPQPIVVIDTKGRYKPATIDPDEAIRLADELIALEEKQSFIEFEELPK